MALCPQASRDAGRAPIRRIGPGVFPTQRRVRPRAVPGEPVPCDPTTFLTRLNPGVPEREHIASS